MTGQPDRRVWTALKLGAGLEDFFLVTLGLGGCLALTLVTEGVLAPAVTAGGFLDPNTTPDRETDTPLALSCSKISDLLEDTAPELPDTEVEEATGGPPEIPETIFLLDLKLYKSGLKSSPELPKLGLGLTGTYF